MKIVELFKYNVITFFSKRDFSYAQFLQYHHPPPPIEIRREKGIFFLKEGCSHTIPKEHDAVLITLFKSISSRKLGYTTSI